MDKLPERSRIPVFSIRPQSAGIKPPSRLRIPMKISTSRIGKSRAADSQSAVNESELSRPNLSSQSSANTTVIINERNNRTSLEDTFIRPGNCTFNSQRTLTSSPHRSNVTYENLDAVNSFVDNDAKICNDERELDVTFDSNQRTLPQTAPWQRKELPSHPKYSNTKPRSSIPEAPSGSSRTTSQCLNLSGSSILDQTVVIPSGTERSASQCLNRCSNNILDHTVVNPSGTERNASQCLNRSSNNVLDQTVSNAPTNAGDTSCETQKRPVNLFLFGGKDSSSPIIVKETTPPRSNSLSPTGSVSSVLDVDFWNPRHTSSPVAKTDIAMQLGQRVYVAIDKFGDKVGVLRYQGHLAGEEGVWCGVELDEPFRNNDGSFRGVQYFTCRPQHGVFVPYAKVRLVRCVRRDTFTVPAGRSGPYSLLAGLQREQTLSTSTESDEDNAVQTPSSVPAVFELSKQNSLEQDESLGILTPDQMTVDFSGFSGDAKTLFNEVYSDTGSSSLLMKTVVQRSAASGNQDSSGWKKKFLALGSDVTLLDDISFPHVGHTVLDSINDDSYGLKNREQSIARVERPPSPEELPVDTPLQEEPRSLTTNELTGNDSYLSQKILALDNDVALLDQISFPGMDSALLDSLMDDSFCLKSPDQIDVPVPKPGSDTNYTPPSPKMDTSERTLSPEDLPVDTPLQDDVPPLPDPELRTDELCDMTGSSSAGPSSRSSAAPVPQLPVPPPPSSFVTSVTSITSLDNGYQGDGEWSRPASRGADQSPTGSAPHVKPPLQPPPPVPADPMTDSDFFTESDADPHEEVPTAMRRGGDRRAQVIDGTLYGSSLPAHHHQRCPSFTASINEEMVSSGVFSDLERRTEETASSDGGKNYPDEEGATIIGDFSPDGSTKTISSKSEHTQVKDSNLVKDDTVILECDAARNLEEENIAKQNQNNMTFALSENSPETIKSPVEVRNASPQTPPKTDLDITSTNSEKTQPATAVNKAPNKETNHPQLKKYKMPKRNVGSKIKALIESSNLPHTRNVNGNGGNASTEEENQENWRPTRPMKPARKPGKWDNVMSKIEQGRAEQKFKPNRLKEVKSKVFANMSTVPQMPGRSSSTVSNVTINNKTKSRRTRTRTTSSSQQQQQKQQQKQQTGPPGSPNSTPGSSMSDLSTGAVQTQTVATNRSSKKQRDAGRSASPLSDGSTNSATSHVMTRPANNHLPRQPPQSNGVNAKEMKTPLARKTPSRRSGTGAGVKLTPLRDQNRLASGGSVVKSEAVTKLQSSPTPRIQPPHTPVVAKKKPNPLLPYVKHNALGFEALCTVVNYLVQDLEAFNTPNLKAELSSMKEKWIKANLDLDELTTSYGRIQDNLNDEKLNHSKQLEELELQHREKLLIAENNKNEEKKQLVEEYEEKLQEVNQTYQLKIQEMHDLFLEEQGRLEKENDERCAELRQEMEALKQSHQVAIERLQGENKQVEEDLQRKVSGLEMENSSLKKQSNVLMESMKKDKDAKLKATAGRCRELQDEVHSLQSVLELKNNQFQELRRENAALSADADQLPGALQKIAALEARVEDLQAQLTEKNNAERMLNEKYKLVVDTLDKEAKQKNRLSLYNEELQWKLKQNTEVVNTLAAQWSGINSPSPSSPASVRRSAPISLQSVVDGPRILQHQISAPASQTQQEDNDMDSSPPTSPKVKGIVKKSDSVAYVLEMEDTAEEMMKRFVQRTNSLRAVNSPINTGNSTGTSKSLPPPKRQRCKTSYATLSTSTSAITSTPRSNMSNIMSRSASPLRNRSKSVSSDSTESGEHVTWSSLLHSTPVSHNNHVHNPTRDTIVTITSNGTNNTVLQHCSDVDIVLHDDELTDDSFITHRSNDIQCWNVASPESSICESPLKSSCSSATSSPPSDDSIRSNGGGAGSNREYKHRKASATKLLLDSSDNCRSLDGLPLPPLPGSSPHSDLSLLASCAAAQQKLLLKESGGEAMVSEETSEDEDEHVLVSSSDENSSQDEDDDVSTSESSYGVKL